MNTEKPNRPDLAWSALLVLILVAATVGQIWAAESAEEANAELQHIGIYDSRAVAYAFFWTNDRQAKRNE